MRFAFLTATPLNVARGSGTYAGITTLGRALEALGHQVNLFAPSTRFPVFTVERLVFNEQLRRTSFDRFDEIVGFDMDGWRVREPHVAALKGVIADEMRFERGATRWTMGIQARCERAHVRRARRVIVTSRYAAARVRELYGREDVAVVPECIDLARWRELLAANCAPPDPAKFTVLAVCRFYPRKRIDVLIRAAARLRIPGLEVRIVGGGPEEERWRRISRGVPAVRWLGTISREDLAREYSRADVFCSPSVQEGFGIVFLEAMAAGKPVVAARAAAVPEVVKEGLLVDPESDEALEAALERLYRSPDLRATLGEAGRGVAAQYDAAPVARAFLTACLQP